MKRLICPALVMVCVAVSFLNCSKSENPLDTKSYSASRVATLAGAANGLQESAVVSLIAGRTTYVGTVTCWIEENTLYIRYATEGDWVLVETHLAAAESLEGIPVTPSGNPKVGHFPLKGIHDPSVTEYSYAVDLEGWGLNEAREIVLAAHASVQLISQGGGVMREEGAWGEGERFPHLALKDRIQVKMNWAMYFTIDVQQLKGQLLWNKLGSEEEVENSEIGADGSINGTPQFVPGKFDNGLYTSTYNWINFTSPNINHANGCLECWIVPKSDWNVGYHYLFHGVGTTGYASIFCWIYDGVLNWSANDSGAGYSAVVTWVPDWTVDTPAHIAFVWDVNNAAERVSLYRDGEKVGEVTSNESWTLKETSYLSVGAHCTGVEPANLVIDNIKIWNYPKIDFSDRFEE